jgi:hypothetical protein
MQALRYQIATNESVTRWKTTSCRKEPFSAPYATFDAPVNTGEAYVQIVYPVRTAFLATHDLSAVTRYEGSYEHITFPFENNRIDFSGFLHTPHILSVNAITWIDVDEGRYPFDIYTCGGIKVWVDGKPTITFAPYTRNIPGTTRLELDLAKGVHQIEVYADDLAERDVFFYFEFRYVGETPIQGVLQSELDPQEILEKERFLRSCSFEHEVYEEGKVELRFDGTILKEPLELTFAASGDGGPWKGADHFTVQPGQGSLVVADCASSSVGAYHVDLGCQLGGHPVQRRLFLSLSPAKLMKVPTRLGVKKRKEFALDFICGSGEEHITRAMAILQRKGKMTEDALRFIHNSLGKIQRKEDCSDFVIVPLLWSIQDQRGMYDEALYQEAVRTILDFRYWIDEPGNDVMWYFSENHAFLFHAAQYLAGHLFPDRTFTASGRTGKEQEALGRKRLLSWFKQFETYHYAEWNSATYLPVDLIGLFTLFEKAPDAEIRRKACDALDYTFSVIKDNSFGGVMIGSCGRCYEKTLKARCQVEPCFLHYVAYDEGYVTSRNRAVALFSLSSYVPPTTNEQLEDGEYLELTSGQGEQRVDTYLFKTNSYATGCAQNFKPFTHGHQQHVQDVSFGRRKNRQFYVNHPGERAFSGENRPSYWAGNGTIPKCVQYRSLTLMLFDIDPGELVHAIHAYTPLPDYDASAEDGNYLFLESDESYVGVWFSQGYQRTTSGANRDKEVISQGLRHGVVIRCGDAAEFGSFVSFITFVKQQAIQFDPNALTLRVTDQNIGTLEEGRDYQKLDGSSYDTTYPRHTEKHRGTITPWRGRHASAV